MNEEMGLRERMTRQGEEAIGKFAQELLENPMVGRALAAAFETRERASRAQEVAMGALNLPSASDLERLTRRLRGVSVCNRDPPRFDRGHPDHRPCLLADPAGRRRVVGCGPRSGWNRSDAEGRSTKEGDPS